MTLLRGHGVLGSGEATTLASDRMELEAAEDRMDEGGIEVGSAEDLGAGLVDFRP